jgi:hypothetical protein
MAPTEYWDPENLLQITGYGKFGEIQCVGCAVTHYNARCRLTKTNQNPEVVEIYNLLASMAGKPPTEVTTENLRRLAMLCLCKEYHSHQKDDTVTRWKSVVKRAAKQYSNNTKKSDTGSDDIVSKLVQQRKECLRLLGKTEDSATDLESLIGAELNTRYILEVSTAKELLAMKEEREAAKALNEELRNKLAATQKELKVASELQFQLLDIRIQEARNEQVEFGRLESALSRAAKELESVKRKNKALTLYLDKIIDRILEKEGESETEGGRRSANEPGPLLEKLEVKLDTSLQKLSRDHREINLLHDENYRLKEQLHDLQNKLNVANDEGKNLRAELLDSKKAVQQMQAQADETRKANSDLAGEMDALRGHVGRLEADISACRLHEVGRLANGIFWSVFLFITKYSRQWRLWRSKGGPGENSQSRA